MSTAYHKAKRLECARAFIELCAGQGCTVEIPEGFNSKTKVSVTCKCGAIRETSYDHCRKSKLTVCRTCSNQLAANSPHVLSQKESALSFLKEKAKEWGASKVEISYGAMYAQASFVCGCGSSKESSLEALRQVGTTMLCAKCSLMYRGWLSKGQAPIIASKESSLVRLKARAKEVGSRIEESSFKSAAEKVTFYCVACRRPKQAVGSALLSPKSLWICFSCMKGELHPLWKASRTPEDREKGRSLYHWWPAKVFKADDWTCVITGQRGGRLAAHHIFNYGDYPELRAHVCNGVSLCRKVHKEFHDRYGRGKNTLKQFQEFYLEKTGRPYINQELTLAAELLLGSP